jgi:hypothetical protein
MRHPRVDRGDLRSQIPDLKRAAGEQQRRLNLCSNSNRQFLNEEHSATYPVRDRSARNYFTVSLARAWARRGREIHGRDTHATRRRTAI